MPPRPVAPGKRGRGRPTRNKNPEPSVGSATHEPYPPTQALPVAQDLPPPAADAAAARGSGADFAREFLHMLQGYIQQQTTPQHGQVPPPPPRTNEVVEQFRRFNPPKFKGKEGPEATEEWIEEVERIFEHMECTEG